MQVCILSKTTMVCQGTNHHDTVHLQLSGAGQSCPWWLPTPPHFPLMPWTTGNAQIIISSLTLKSDLHLTHLPTMYPCMCARGFTCNRCSPNNDLLSLYKRIFKYCSSHTLPSISTLESLRSLVVSFLLTGNRVASRCKPVTGTMAERTRADQSIPPELSVYTHLMTP
jgi:hypothetical protein